MGAYAFSSTRWGPYGFPEGCASYIKVAAFPILPPALVLLSIMSGASEKTLPEI
ncbi:hypothetical protein NBRC3293_0234 [Gluconobacter oxydans NBRC 3293]|uniref:Uncharacterized protein n=1 Tax=Gluconobacter oxydans NBRC 3293 TaxID=1315969 RepID=A0A829WYI8_GLUOY|nr:hypothetical protein NBRC3293_0234 [Gluconobacter oxydans NBRC 3293]